MIKKLFNPFIYLAGGKALAFGLVSMTLAAVLGFLSQSHFNGVLDFHKFNRQLPLYVSFAEQVIVLTCLVVPFYIGGRIFSKSQIRLIDVAGTLALARYPMIFTALTGFGLRSEFHGIEDITAGVILMGLIALVLIIWMVALTYNAFSVSCNLKGIKNTSVFIACLLTAEVSAYMLCGQLYSHF